MKVIIVGGVAGGASTVARLRRLDEKAEITIYEKSGYISYANCGLPYFIGEIIQDKNELTLQTPESFYNRFHVEAKTNHEVIKIDAENKCLTIRNLKTGETFQEHYDKLVLSPGAKAIKPNILNVDLENIFTLRTVEDTFRIFEYVKSVNAKTATVVGGGFVGLETAENLKQLGLEVTVIEAAPQVFSIFDSDMVPQVHSVLRKNGINLILDDRITSFEKENGRTTSILSSGKKISADLILLAIGVVPDTDLAKDANLELGTRGSIMVNDRMESSNSDIYAVGDAVEVRHFITGNKTLIPLAGPANKQGRIAADNIAGGDSRYKGTQGSSVMKLFDLTLAATGINERQAKIAGLDFEKVIISPVSHASYYPGGKLMTIKLLFEKQTERILGAQIIGFEGVDKRIDIIATAIRTGMKATELAELELSYAPPYSSAKDPVNMLGFVAENLVSGKVKQFYYEDITKLIDDNNVLLLDVRTVSEYDDNHVDGFVNIPVDELRERFAEISSDKPIYVMCQSGIRSYIACRILSETGYECFNFAGGYRFYSLVKNEQIASVGNFDRGADK